MSIPSSGSSTARSASTTCSFVGTTSMLAEQAHLFAALAREEMDPVHEADPVAAGAHDERVGAGAVGEEADAAEEVAVRDAGRDDDHLAGRDVLGHEHALDVLDARLAGLLDLAARRRPELRLQLAAETAKRGGGHDR